MVRTDAAWETLARRDPYWGAITHPAFLGPSLTTELEDQFFASGDRHVEHVLAAIDSSVRPGFRPSLALDYGCGVGRNLPALARSCDHVIGMDVSPTMLTLAGRLLQRRGIDNVELRPARDLPGLPTEFDLVHCVLVLQHISPRRGMAIFSSLLSVLGPGGCACVQFHLHSPGRSLARAVRMLRARSATLNRLVVTAAGRPRSARHVLMHEYDLDAVTGLLTERGITTLHVETDTGSSGDVSATVYAASPPSRRSSPGRPGNG